MTVSIVTKRMADDVVVVAGKGVYVFVDPENFRPVAVPEEIRQALG